MTDIICQNCSTENSDFAPFCRKCGRGLSYKKDHLLEYWKTRCLSAEKYIAASPCDPDMDPDQWKAYGEWRKIVLEEITI